MFRWNLPPALLAERPGSFTCHCGNTGVERTPNKSHHTKLTLEKKILPLLLPGFELTTCRSRVRRSTNTLYYYYYYYYSTHLPYSGVELMTQKAAASKRRLDITLIRDPVHGLWSVPNLLPMMEAEGSSLQKRRICASNILSLQNCYPMQILRPLPPPPNSPRSEYPCLPPSHSPPPSNVKILIQVNSARLQNGRSSSVQ